MGGGCDHYHSTLVSERRSSDAVVAQRTQSSKVDERISVCSKQHMGRPFACSVRNTEKPVPMALQKPDTLVLAAIGVSLGAISAVAIHVRALGIVSLT